MIRSMALTVVIVAATTLLNCTKYHTRAFWTSPKTECKYVGEYKCWIWSFAAYQRGWSDPGYTYDWENDSTFEMQLNIADEGTSEVPDNWWKQQTLKDSLSRELEAKASRLFHMDSLVLRYYPDTLSVTVYLDEDRPAQYIGKMIYHHFEPVDIPRRITEIDAMFHYSKRDIDGTVLDRDSVVFRVYRQESHRWEPSLGNSCLSGGP